MTQSEYIEVGYISGHFGVRGEVKLYSYTRPIGDITQYKKFYLGDNKTPLNFSRLKESGKHIIGKVADANNRDDVLELIGIALFVKADDLPELSDGEFYWRELIGLSVKTTNGAMLGQIDSIFETGANDVLVIKDKAKAADDILIPYVLGHFIVAVDLDKQLMTVDWESDDEDVDNSTGAGHAN